MKRTKKIITICFALALCMGSLLTTVSADTKSYSFKFNSTSPTLPVSSGYKDDSDKNYYITINGGNISSKNRFGTKIRKAGNNAAVSGYVVHQSRLLGAPYRYSTSVDTSTRYFMRGKKDDSSKTSAALTVKGRVTY